MSSARSSVRPCARGGCSIPDPEQTAAARRWLRFAREDLRTARLIDRQPDGVPRECCWLAQQAAEKALKAALVFLGVDFPRTHNLADLRRLLPSAPSQQRSAGDLAQLSRWGVEARYPGDWPEASQDDARTAMAEAQSILADVASALAAHGVADEELP